MTTSVAVIGAGAAGFMAACHAAGPGRRVLLLDRTADGGRKILISGGGRCNILPGALDEGRFVTASSTKSLRNILRSWPLTDQRRFFEETLRIPLVLETESGKLFPASDRARDVRDGFARHARERGVEFLPNTAAVDLVPGGGRWTISLAGANPLHVDRVIVATGGLSVPQTGSDGAGLAFLARLGLKIHPTYPALTPLTVTPNPFGDLAGISLRVTVRATSSDEQSESTGGFLFTHRGYSGPAVLDVSHVAVRSRLRGGPPAELRIQWCDLDEAAWQARLAPGVQAVATVLRAELPARLADRLLELVEIERRTSLSQLTRAARLRLLDALMHYSLPWTGDEGYKKAEVTGGGVALHEVHPRTLECRHHPGLFLCGELLDAFGPIGGYNFAWSWVTGRLAGMGATGDHSPDHATSA